MVVAWMLWEIWSVIRVEGARLQPARPIRPPNANGVPQAPRGNPGEAGAAGAGLQDDNQNGVPRPGPAARPAGLDGAEAPVLPANVQLAYMLDYLSSYHLQWEREQLGIDLPPAGSTEETPVQGPEAVPPHLVREPTRGEQVQVFVILFVYSLLPEVWARRVDALRLREGQIREVYGRDWDEALPADDAEENAENARIRRFAERRQMLTGWRRDYVKRVLGGAGQDVDL